MRPVARIAQSVEQGIENPRVPGSIPGSGTIFKLVALATSVKGLQLKYSAGVVELVDTPASGAGARKGVEVQVLSSVPTFKPRQARFFCI